MPCDGDKCLPGQEKRNGVCVDCPAGYASSDGTECVRCQDGWTGIGKIAYYNRWDSLPDGWSTECEGPCSGEFATVIFSIYDICDSFLVLVCLVDGELLVFSLILEYGMVMVQILHLNSLLMLMTTVL